jgi:hypothetical protein
MGDQEPAQVSAALKVGFTENRPRNLREHITVPYGERVCGPPSRMEQTTCGTHQVGFEKYLKPG